MQLHVTQGETGRESREPPRKIVATKAGHCGEPECETESREFQNAIYTRRASSPLILPLLYPWRRPKMERQMNVGADQLLKELGIEP
jgi:hypothetical protein